MATNKRKDGWLIWALLVFLYLCYAYFFLSDTAYKYPTIANMWNFWTLTIPNFVLPVIVLVAMAICIAKKIRAGTIICGILIPALLVLGFWRCYEEIQIAPAMCSYTDDAADFADYDPKVEEFMRLNASKHFPDVLPQDACNMQYSYFYQSTSNEELYVAVSWEWDDQKIQALFDALSSSYESTMQDSQWRIELTEQRDPTGTPRWLRTVVLLDWNEHTVTYVATGNRKLLPASSGDVLWKMESIVDVIEGN